MVSGVSGCARAAGGASRARFAASASAVSVISAAGGVAAVASANREKPGETADYQARQRQVSRNFAAISSRRALVM
jgi:hypothetical protein